jgi:hypothetical protein
MRLITLIAAGTFLLATGGATAQQYPTIVGDWYEPEYGPSDCGQHFGINIQPMAMKYFDDVCQFDDVRRDGWKVTWTGQCTAGAEWQRNMTVVAVETEGRLRIDWSDGSNLPDLRRCPK